MEQKEVKEAPSSVEAQVADNLPVSENKTEEQASETREQTSFERFVNNEDNRKVAQAHAVNLWKIVSGNEPIENAADRVITETEVVHKTTLSHKKAKELFNFLHAFGFLRYIDDKIHFVLLFDSDQQRKTIQYEIDALTDALSNDIARYKICLKNDTTLSEEEKKKTYEDFKSGILNSILF